MADFEPDGESVARAGSLSARLMRDLRTVAQKRPDVRIRQQLFSERHYADSAGDAPIGDVLEHVGEMATEFAISRRLDGEILCATVGDGEIVPISLRDSLAGGPLPFGGEHWFELWEREFPFPRRFWRDAIKRATREGDEDLVVTPVDEAEEMTARNLTSFLSFRFAGMKQWSEWIQGIGNHFGGGGGGLPPSNGSGGNVPAPPAVGPGGGLQVQVSCRTPGLRLHVSPAYFVSWVFFGSPTTPVASYVLPGRYIFAGDGPMRPRRTRDHGVFAIPPTYYPALTRF